MPDYLPVNISRWCNAFSISSPVEAMSVVVLDQPVLDSKAGITFIPAG